MTLILVMTVMGLRIEPKIQDSDMCVCKPIGATSLRCFVEETNQSKVKIITVLDSDDLPAEAKVKVLCSKEEVTTEELVLD